MVDWVSIVFWTVPGQGGMAAEIRRGKWKKRWKKLMHW
jgi:hypothetical protein